MWNVALYIASGLLIVLGIVWIGYTIIVRTSRKAGGDGRELGMFKKSTERQAKADFVFRGPHGTDSEWIKRQRLRLRRIHREKP